MDGRVHLLTVVHDNDDGDSSLFKELKVTTTLKDHEKFVVDCDFTADGKLFVTCGRDKSVNLYVKNDTGEGYAKSRSFVLPNNPECLRFAPDASTLIVSARGEPFLRYLDVVTLDEKRVSLNDSKWDTHVSFDVLCLAVSDTHVVAATSKDRHIVYRLGDNRHFRILTGHASDDYANTRVALMRNTVVSSSSSVDLFQWDLTSGKLLTKVERAHGQPVRNLDVLQDQLILATCSFDKYVRLWPLVVVSSS